MSIIRFLLRNAPWLSAGVLLTFLSSFGQTFFISIFAGEIRAEFGLSQGAWGGIYSLGTAASAAVMIWAGALTDVFRVRVIGPVVLIGLAMACLAMASVSAVWLLPVAIFLLRLFGQGMSSHIAVVAMSRWFVATRGRALSVATLGFSAGEAVLPLTFVGLMAIVDWHWLWVVGAIVCLVGAPALIALLRHERTPQTIALSHSSTGMQDRHWLRAQTLRHPLFWLMVPGLLGPSAFNTAFFFHQVHFAELKGWSHLDLVALFPFYTATSIGAMMVSGWALDRLGSARLMPFFQLPMVVSFLLFSTVQSVGGMVVAFLFLAMTTGANSTLPNAFWAEFYGTAHIGAIKAMAAAVMVLGSAVGPGITGMLIDFGMELEAQYLWIAGFFLLSTALMGVGIVRYRRFLPVWQV